MSQIEQANHASVGVGTMVILDSAYISWFWIEKQVFKI